MDVMHAVFKSASERLMLREVLYKWINTIQVLWMRYIENLYRKEKFECLKLSRLLKTQPLTFAGKLILTVRLIGR